MHVFTEYGKSSKALDYATLLNEYIYIYIYITKRYTFVNESIDIYILIKKKGQRERKGREREKKREKRNLPNFARITLFNIAQTHSQAQHDTQQAI